jgi:hypothetical protein
MPEEKKQIEELGKEIYQHCSAGLFEDEANAIAEFVINKQGYRKASDVVRKVIEDVISLLEDNWNDIQHGTYWLTNGRCVPLRELLKNAEKQYTEVK